MTRTAKQDSIALIGLASPILAVASQLAETAFAIHAKTAEPALLIVGRVPALRVEIKAVMSAKTARLVLPIAVPAPKPAMTRSAKTPKLAKPVLAIAGSAKNSVEMAPAKPMKIVRLAPKTAENARLPAETQPARSRKTAKLAHKTAENAQTTVATPSVKTTKIAKTAPKIAENAPHLAETESANKAKIARLAKLTAAPVKPNAATRSAKIPRHARPAPMIADLVLWSVEMDNANKAKTARLAPKTAARVLPPAAMENAASAKIAPIAPTIAENAHPTAETRSVAQTKTAKPAPKTAEPAHPTVATPNANPVKPATTAHPIAESANPSAATRSATPTKTAKLAPMIAVPARSNAATESANKAKPVPLVKKIAALAPPQCGDGKCEQGETCTTCAKDCGACPDQCGDGVCGPTEGCNTCPADCKTCAGQKCQTDTECGAGFLCLEPDYNNPAKDKYCFQSCSNDLLRCLGNTDGRTRCAPITAALRVCLKDAKASEDCGQKAKFQSRCLDNPPLYCSATSSLCQTPTIQTQPGAPCDLPPYTTEPPKICDPNQKLVCDAQTKTCIAAQQSDEGKECDPSGLVIGQKVLCTGTQLCIDFGPFGQRCHRPCSVGTPNSCAHNAELSCQTISFSPGSPSVCMDLKCNTDAECAFADYICSGTPGTPKVCRPPGPVGPLDFGAVCSTDPTQSKTLGCKSGLICIPRNANQSLGICSRDCTVDPTVCQPFSTAGTTYITQCESSTLGFRACGVLCQGGSLQCPVGTSCNNGRCAP